MIWPVDPQRYLLFLGVTAIFAATPGPAVLFSIATGVAQGKRAVLAAVVGINSATLVWFAGAALGLGAVMAAAPWLFRCLAWLGVAYLLWLGGKALARCLRVGDVPARPQTLAMDEMPPAAAVRPSWLVWREGFLIQIVNPKVLLFFTTVLPPFLDVHRPAAPQAALFALGPMVLDTLGLSAYGLGGAALASRLREPRNARRFAFLSGLLLIIAASLIGFEQIAR